MSSRDFVHQLGGEHGLSSSRLSTRLHLDWLLLVSLALVCTSGLVVLYSGADGNMKLVWRQAAYMGLGTLSMVLLAQIEPATYRRWALPVYLGGVALLVATLFAGADAKGAQRWLQIPGVGVRLQPSEIMKIAVPMMVGAYLSRRPLPPSPKHLAGALLICLIPALLIFRQPDLGTAILIAASGLFVIFLAGLSWKWIAGFVALVATAAPLFWFYVMHDYQKQRVLTFLDPSKDPLGAGWNIIQSETAIGSGGLWGKGWLLGTQSHLDFLPESHTDFIIAVLAEEFGYVGVLALLAGYLLIIGRGLYMAATAQDTFCRVVAGALTLTFFVYVLVNMGMVSGLLPVVGVPLPLISYGGTSILTLLSAFGVIMSLHTHRRMLGY
ncbi:MAG: rod shape-determining protein RodA [Gammaproteobacteria bacterium]|nr:MAG: rod shape-determining protein RodA [Gammaproteobacteria bacterium]